MKEITEEMLDALRAGMQGLISARRFVHTAAVERMIVRLCGLYCPEQTVELRAAALLHDMTKEKSTEEQAELCRQYGVVLTAQDLLAPKTLHARSAAAMIPTLFPEFATGTVVSAVRWHTTGRADMTLTEKLLYLADYIDDSRTFPSCVLLRRTFFEADPDRMSAEERTVLLRDTLLLSFDLTVKDLLAEGSPVAEDTIRARNGLLLERAGM